MIVVNPISSGKKVYHLEGRLSSLKGKETFTADLGVPIQQYCVAGHCGSGVWMTKSSYFSYENYSGVGPDVKISSSKITITNNGNESSIPWNLVYWLLG